MAHRGVLTALVLLMAADLVGPVLAHTTIGNLNGTPPFFRSDDHELNPTNTFGTAHVPGPLGYVWPGGGSNFYTGGKGFPGYQSPFQNFEEPLQVAGNYYSPEGAMLTSTPGSDNVGDLIFAINFSQPRAFVTPSNPSPTFRYNNVTIYIPAPIVDKYGQLLQDGFEPAGGINWELGDSSNILSTLTSDYGRVFVGRADMNDPFGPGWWAIRITPSGSGIVFTAGRGWKEWYYIRVNQLRAPDIAGRYLFKIFLGDHYPVKHQSSPLINSTMPVENWPVLLVKGEVDPAIIYGTVRYGQSHYGPYFGEPIRVAGRVRAVGTATDPLTGTLTNRAVEARGYFNATAEGHYEMEGVAPGIYDLYASAAGFPEQRLGGKVTVRRGQSLNIDLSLSPGPEVHGEVYSKGCLGLTPWRSQLPISIVIYDSDNYIEDNVASYSPINLTHSPYTSYVSGNTIFDSGKLAPPNSPKLVAFPWEGPVSYYPYTAAPPFRDPYGVHNGVGPAQVWWVSPTSTLDPVTGLGSDSSSFRFQFGAYRYYGAPRLLSGMVPQAFATWIDGLRPGRYFVRAHLNGYVQTDIAGSNFRNYHFDITEGHTGSVSLFMDLWLTGTVNLTVHFHDKPGNTQTQPIGGPDPARFLIVEAFDPEGSLAAFNFTYVYASSRSATITLNGLGMAGVIPPPDPRAGVKYSLFRYRGLRDYGVPSGTYFLRMYMRGYIQASPPAVRVEDLDQPSGFSFPSCNHSASLSAHMFRGAGINVTVYSVNWQSPPSQSLWRWNGTSISLLVYDVESRGFIDVVYFWNAASGGWTLPTTNSKYSTVPWPDWRSVFGSSSSMLVTNGSTILERLGPDLPNFPSPFPEQDVASNVFLQSLVHIGFLYSPQSYRARNYRSTVAIYQGLYSLTGWTYGYVQERVISIGDLGTVFVSAGLGQIADISIRLIQGAEFDLKILFRKEGLPTGLPANMSMRIRIYDENDILVAAASTSFDIGAVLPSSNVGFFADGKKVANAGAATPPIPAGTLQVEYRRLAGLTGYVDPTIGGEAVRRLTLFSPDVGVWGSSSTPIAGAYTGGWQVLVEMVSWYRPSEFYPPPPGLLQGESHLTKLAALIPYNHLGPFELRDVIKIPNVGLGGRASVILSLDLRGMITGAAAAYNMQGDLRGVSWAAISMKGKESCTVYSWDGFYDVYLTPGAYTVTIEEPGLKSQTVSAAVPDGEVVSLTFYLRPSGIPIPEISLVRLLPTVAAGASISLLFGIIRGRKKIKQASFSQRIAESKLTE